MYILAVFSILGLLASNSFPGLQAMSSSGGYVEKAGAEGCGKDMITQEECERAASSLGYKSANGYEVVDYAHLPHGCFVGHENTGWTYTYYNSNAGKINAAFKSICKNANANANATETPETDVESAAQETDRPYQFLGCWKDKAERALTDLEHDVAEPYKSRDHPIQKCLEAAKSRGYKIFAIQDGGQCFGSEDLKSYQKYGRSTDCLVMADGGKGGPMANSVYQIVGGVVAENETVPVPQTTVATTEDENNGECCNKVLVQSDGEAKNYQFWAMGTFTKNQTSGEYVQFKTRDNRMQYYLAKTETGGWKIGRKYYGQVEKLVYYEDAGDKLKCPNDKPQNSWMVSTGTTVIADAKLKVQCFNVKINA